MDDNCYQPLTDLYNPPATFPLNYRCHAGQLNATRILQRDAYSSGHLVLSFLSLAFVLILKPFFPELVMSTELLSYEHPSVLLFCSLSCENKSGIEII